MKKEVACLLLALGTAIPAYCEFKKEASEDCGIVCAIEYGAVSKKLSFQLTGASGGINNQTHYTLSNEDEACLKMLHDSFEHYKKITVNSYGFETNDAGETNKAVFSIRTSNARAQQQERPTGTKYNTMSKEELEKELTTLQNEILDIERKEQADRLALENAQKTYSEAPDNEKAAALIHQLETSVAYSSKGFLRGKTKLHFDEAKQAYINLLRDEKTE